MATRYEKTAASFAGVLCLVAAMDWTKRDHAAAVRARPRRTPARPAAP